VLGFARLEEGVLDGVVHFITFAHFEDAFYFVHATRNKASQTQTHASPANK